MAICAGPYFNGLWKPAKKKFPSFNSHPGNECFKRVFLGGDTITTKKDYMFR